MKKFLHALTSLTWISNPAAHRCSKSECRCRNCNSRHWAVEGIADSRNDLSHRHRRRRHIIYSNVRPRAIQCPDACARRILLVDETFLIKAVTWPNETASVQRIDQFRHISSISFAINSGKTKNSKRSRSALQLLYSPKFTSPFADGVRSLRMAWLAFVTRRARILAVYRNRTYKDNLRDAGLDRCIHQMRCSHLVHFIEERGILGRAPKYVR